MTQHSRAKVLIFLRLGRDMSSQSKSGGWAQIYHCCPTSIPCSYFSDNTGLGSWMSLIKFIDVGSLWIHLDHRKVNPLILSAPRLPVNQIQPVLQTAWMLTLWGEWLMCHPFFNDPPKRQIKGHFCDTHTHTLGKWGKTACGALMLFNFKYTRECKFCSAQYSNCVISQY